MKPLHGQRAPQVLLGAAQRALTLVVILAAIGLLAWLAGAAALADLPWLLGGAFAGSFATALVRLWRGTPQRR